jgi:hypothetical protein
MVTGGTYGFDLSPCDADTPGDVRDTQIWWNSQVGTAWNNEPTWGDIYLDPRPLVAPVPEAPTNLVASPSSGSVSLTWDAAAGFVDEYRIYQSETSGVYTSPVSTTTLTTHLVTGLTNDTEYFFVVTAANESGEGPQSNEASATPRAGLSLRARSWRHYR